MSDWRAATALEQFVWKSDPGGPSLTFRSEVTVVPSIDVEKLSNAVGQVAKRQPLLFGRLVPNGSGLAWEAVPSLTTAKAPTFPIGTVSRDRISSIDLSQAAGCRVGLRDEQADQQVITLDYHHAAVDGTAGARCLSQILRCYAGQKLSDRDHQDKLSLRREYPLPDDGRPIGGWEGLRNLWLTIRGRAIRYEPSIQCDGMNHDPMVNATLSVEQSSRIRAEIGKWRSPVNDFGLAGTFRWLADDPTLKRASGRSRAGRLMVMNPVDLRSVGHRHMPAANMTGYVFIRRRPAEIAAETFLDGLCMEMDYVRRRNVGAEFLRGMDLLQSRPKMMDFVVRRRWFDPAASFTCMTNLKPGLRTGCVRTEAGWMLGDHRIVSIRVTPPRQSGTAVAVALTESLGSYSLTLRGDPSIFSSDQLSERAFGWFKAFGGLVQKPANEIQITT